VTYERAKPTYIIGYVTITSENTALEIIESHVSVNECKLESPPAAYILIILLS